MAKKSYLTSTALIEDIKRRALIPTSQNTFSDQDFLRLADEELAIGVIPYITSLQEEYFVVEESTPIVSNQSAYQIPSRAIGMKLRDLFYKDTQGSLQQMTRISPDDRSYFQSSNLEKNYISFYCRGDEVVLTPNVGDNASGSLVFTFFIHPNQLVLDKEVAQISSILVDDVAKTTTFNCVVPSTMVSAFNSNTSQMFDIQQEAGGHKLKDYDMTAVSISGTSIIFNTASLPTGSSTPVIGDFICLSGECCIPQIPDQLHSMLGERVAARCLAAMGDNNSLSASNSKIAEMEAKTGLLLDDRVEGAPKKIVNYNSIMRQSRIRRRGWW